MLLESPNKGFQMSYRRRICGSFFLSLSFSHSLALKSSTYLCENIILGVKTLPYFTQMIIFSPNTSFWTKKGVIWWLLYDDLRARERKWEEKGVTNSAPHSALKVIICGGQTILWFEPDHEPIFFFSIQIF